MDTAKSVLTAKQKEVLSFICDFSDVEGYPPTYKEIAKHFNFSSEGTVRTHLILLEKKGCIIREGKARGIKITRKIITNKIPILGNIAAGTPSQAIQEFTENISDIPELKYHKDRFALRIRGESMKEIGILDGDIVIIQKETQIQNGQIAAVLIDNEATLKRVYFEKEKIKLQAENKSFAPIYLNPNSFETKLLGKYIALIRT
ncbi:transcriptional repressor LexA [Candidatus Margulisiibacteriota bacterium]